MKQMKLLVMIALFCLFTAGCNRTIPIGEVTVGTYVNINAEDLLVDEKGRLWLSKEALANTFTPEQGLLVGRGRDGYGVSVHYLERNGTPCLWSLTPKAYDSSFQVVPVVGFSGSDQAKDRWYDMDGHLILPPSMEDPTSLAKRLEHGKPISEIGVGESCWITPDCVYADAQRRLYLRGQEMAYDRPAGLGEIQIMRTEHGYAVDLAKAPDARWNTGIPLE